MVYTARSALSSVLVLPNGIAFGQHSYVKRLLKGVFETKPALPRYTRVWDVESVLTYLNNLGANTKLKSKVLTLKITEFLGSILLELA